MIFQDNVIKEYLRNVYFITGTPCGGKTTITRALGEKYGIPVYVIDDQFTIHQAMSDREHQPNMNRSFRDADEFFGRSVEEYKNWLLGNSREQLDYILLDLIKLSRDRIVLCDLHIVAEEAERITDPSRIAFLIKEPVNLTDASTVSARTAARMDAVERIGHVAAKEDDLPAHVEPCQDDGEEGEGAVHRIRLGYAHLRDGA